MAEFDPSGLPPNANPADPSRAAGTAPGEGGQADFDLWAHGPTYDPRTTEAATPSGTTAESTHKGVTWVGVPGSPDGPPTPTTTTEHTPGAITKYLEEASRPAERVDRANRYTDVELLGKSFRVQRKVTEASLQAEKGFKFALAKMRNGIALPNRGVKLLARRIAQTSHDRKMGRLEAARAKNASQLALSVHEDAVKKSSQRLENRKKAVNDHRGVAEGRLNRVRSNTEAFRTEYIKELKQKRGDALARKAVRKQLRTEGVSYLRAKELVNNMVANMPKDHLNRVGNAALVHETTRRRGKEAQRHERKVGKAYEKTGKHYSKTASEMLKHESDKTWATQVADEIEAATLPKIEQQIHTLEARINHMHPNNPDRVYAVKALEEARKEWGEYNEHMVRQRNAATASGQSADQVRTRRDALRGTQAGQRFDQIQAAKVTEGLRTEAATDREALNQEVTAVLNSSKTK